MPQQLQLGHDPVRERQPATAQHLDAVFFAAGPQTGLAVGLCEQPVLQVPFKERDRRVVSVRTLEAARLSAQSDRPLLLEHLVFGVLRERRTGEDQQQEPPHFSSRSFAVRLSTGQKSSVSTWLPAMCFA